MHRDPPVFIAFFNSTLWNHPSLFLGITSEPVHIINCVCPWPRDKCIFAFLVYIPENRGYHSICIVWLFFYLLDDPLVIWFRVSWFYGVILTVSLCIPPFVFFLFGCKLMLYFIQLPKRFLNSFRNGPLYTRSIFCIDSYFL